MLVPSGTALRLKEHLEHIVIYPVQAYTLIGEEGDHLAAD
jgi:hypothetical protein